MHLAHFSFYKNPVYDFEIEDACLVLKSSLCSSLELIIVPTSNFETDNNHLGPGLNLMAGDLTARTCTHE